MAPAAKPSGPMDRLKNEASGLVDALAERATTAVRNKVQDTTGRLTEYVEGGGGPGLMAAVTGAKSMAEGKSPGRSMLSAGFAGVKEKVKGMFGKGGGGGKQKLKLTNIVESIDVGVPIRLAYNQWTQFEDFPTFTKKVEQARPDDDGQKVNWKAQIFWSHREWSATITDQRPDERIIWRSEGQKGHVDGAVTFHELGPNLTKIVVVLEYHPQGLFERTGNLWRAQGRRARLELKHFQRHVMAHALLNPDDIEGWRGTIEDGEVVKDHETALREEQERGGEEPADEFDDQDRAEGEGSEVEDEARDEERDEEREAQDDEADDADASEDERADENGSRERPAARRRSSGNGRRPAASRAGRSEDRPQRARRGATQGRTS
jgi:Polyketide cyclase / dehydrase and lipid transport